MANVPTPRSFNQILSDMLDSFLSKYNLPGIGAGSPLLDVMEAAAQSDLRASQDVFQMIASVSLDAAEDIALDRIGASENLLRGVPSLASGVVTIGDSAITKKATKVYAGQSAPIVGSQTLYVTDASTFPATGALYIGRGTANVEGPLTYTACVNSGNYWTITLNPSFATQQFHNLGESVVLAQGGDRQTVSGTVVRTSTNNASDTTNFKTLYTVTIPDGESSISGVIVVAQTAGTSGNVAAGAINGFNSLPFATATVRNDLPFSNGQPREDKETFRERIRAVRQSRAKGTDLAIRTAVQNIASVDENKRVTSSSIVKRQGYPTTLYIDDGTGYEERSQGIVAEVLVDSAVGGERYFQLSRRPVTKAYVAAINVAPYNVVIGSNLYVKMGGQVFTHQFAASDFRSASNASAYEVVASINGNSSLPFMARTLGAGTGFAVFAIADTNESLEVISGSNDANASLRLASGLFDTLHLYKNDRLLSKDGAPALVVSNPISQWQIPSISEMLILSVDKTPAAAYTITSQDFVDAGTGLTSPSTTDVVAWSQVLNYKIPGITAIPGPGTITLISNLGSNARASISIIGGSLTTKKMFNVGSSTGRANDYTLNRNNGQVALTVPLIAGDRLAVSTAYTRAFVESSAFTSVTTAAQADMYFAVDGNATSISLGVRAGSTINYNRVSTGPAVIDITASNLSEFLNVKVDDYLVIFDSNAVTELKGVFKVIAITANKITVSRPTFSLTTGSFALNEGFFYVVRSSTPIQILSFPAATYTAASLATAINALIEGANATTYRSTKVRVSTNSYSGDIALLAQNNPALSFLFKPTSAPLASIRPHAAVVTSGLDSNIPDFYLFSATAPASVNTFTATGLRLDSQILGVRSAFASYNSNVNQISNITNVSGSLATLRENAYQSWEGVDVLTMRPYHITAQDVLSTIIDKDAVAKRFNTNLYRKLKPTSNTYSSTVTLKDRENTNQTLALTFGLTYNFNDYALYMKSRCVVHPADNTKSALYRYYRFGNDGSSIDLAYTYPTAASQPVSLSLDNTLSNDLIKISLASGARKTFTNLRSTTKLGVAVGAASSLKYFGIVSGLQIASASRSAGVVVLTLTLPTLTNVSVTDHGFNVGNRVYVNSGDVNFPSGLKLISARTTTTISYVESGTTVFPGIGISGRVSYDYADATLTASSSIVANDVAVVHTGSSLTTPIETPMTVIQVTGTDSLSARSQYDSSIANSTVLTWSDLGNAANLEAFPLNAASNTVNSIVTTVNALTNGVVTGTVLGTGTGTISQSTVDEALDYVSPYFLTDGIRYVQSVTLPATITDDYIFTLKSATIAPNLVNSADFINEEIRVVPLNAPAVAAWLGSQASSGLQTATASSVASNGHSVNVASINSGSNGYVQVAGGTANKVATPVISNIFNNTLNNATYLPVDKVESLGFAANHFVKLANAKMVVKQFGSTDGIASITADGTLTLLSRPAWSYIAGPFSVSGARIAKHGGLMFYTLPNAVGALKGGYVYIADDGSGSILDANKGVFQIVDNVSSKGFWIENVSGVEQSLTQYNVYLISNGTAINPGDTFTVNSTTAMGGNVGTWKVLQVGPQYAGSQYELKLQGTFTPYTNGGSVLLGTDAPYVFTTEGQARFWYNRINRIVPSSDGVTDYLESFGTTPPANLAGLAYGSTVTALSKLEFSTDIAQGADGYQYSVGLIGEANRVIYGDLSSSATYPGVIASGDNVNIAGPTIKKISVSLGVRVRSGFSLADIEAQVKSAVASYINKAPIGQPLAISGIVASATKVQGVSAISVLSPTYSGTSDLIPVQPQEKPFVLNLDTDVSVSFVGT